MKKREIANLSDQELLEIANQYTSIDEAFETADIPLVIARIGKDLKARTSEEDIEIELP